MDPIPPRARITLCLQSRLPAMAAAAAAALPTSNSSSSDGSKQPASQPAADAAGAAATHAFAFSHPGLASALHSAGLVSSAGSRVARGVLLPLPPTLLELRQAALDLARANPYWKQILLAAKQKRRRERAERKKQQRKRARIEQQQQQQQQQAGVAERKEPDADDDANGVDDEDGNDSEEEGQKPALWPFQISVSIDNGELCSKSMYSALVRDRDLVEARLLVLDAEGAKALPIEEYVGASVAAQAAEAAGLGMPFAEAGVAAAAGAGGVAQPASVAREVVEIEEKVASPAVPHSRVSAGATHPTPTPRAHSKQAAGTTASTSSSATQHAPGPHDEPASSTNRGAATMPAKSASTSSVATAPSSDEKQSVYPCSSEGCNKGATLGPCPHCVKAGRMKVFFCSQACYAQNWKKHSAQFHPDTA